MEDKFLKLQNKIINIIGISSFGILSICYLLVILMMIFNGWTIFYNGVGDFIISLLITSFYALISGIFYTAKKHEMNWLNIIVALGTALFVLLLPPKFNKIDPSKDRRKYELRAAFPHIPTQNTNRER